MKKIIPLLALMLLAGGAAHAQWRAGAGYASATMVARESLTESGEKSVFNGLYAGASYSLPLAGGLSFTPGAYYEYLAHNAKAEVSILDLLGETREHYLCVPLTLEYAVGLSPDVRLVLFAGPTLRLGIASTTSYSIGWGVRDFEVLKGGLSDRNYNNGDYSRFDLMVGGGVAMEFLDHVRVQIGYDEGLLNRYIGEKGVRLHDHRLTAGIAYLF